MDAAEVRWRVASLLRDTVDRGRVPLGLIPRHVPAGDLPAWRISDVQPGAWSAPTASARERAWAARLTAAADDLAASRLSFLGLDGVDLGRPVNWHREHEAGRDAPRRFSGAIDYRAYDVTGDCKLVWEPNRHHHLVVLARAYRATGQQQYARVLFEHIDSWIDQNPFGRGMNWRSPLEVAIRVISWAFAVDLARESDAFTPARRARISEWALLHVWEVQRKFSRGSSANNHLIGEAAGVFIGAAYFGGSPAWIEESRAILETEAARQTYPDGLNREQATGYHLFVLEFLLFAGIVAERSGRPLHRGYGDQVQRMFEALGRLSEGGEALPMFGDADDGYVADFGDRSDEARALLSLAAVRFRRGDFKQWARDVSEPARWLGGADAETVFGSLPAVLPPRLASHAFEHAGIYLLQSGERDGEGRISVSVDCAELGYQSIAAHGHADALSVTIRAFGDDIVVDPGTYDYFTHPRWRTYFRSTRAHNTCTVDDQDQSVMLGPFLWGQRATARCVEWRAGDDGASLVAEHDGYRRLADPVVHRRTVRLVAASGVVLIEDTFTAAAPHRYTLYFHFAESCEVSDAAQNIFRIRSPHGRLRLAVDRSLTTRLAKGAEEPEAGWVSRSYHRKVPATTLIGWTDATGGVSFRSEFTLSDD